MSPTASPPQPTRRPPSALNLHRQALGLRQEDLAGLVGLTREQISNLERGKNQPRMKTAQAIARVLGVPMDTIFNDERRSPTSAAVKEPGGHSRHEPV